MDLAAVDLQCWPRSYEYGYVGIYIIIVSFGNQSRIVVHEDYATEMELAGIKHFLSYAIS